MDLIKRLCCAPENRLGRNGIEDFKRHPFFAGIDWEGIWHSSPPYTPEVMSPIDTSNFDQVDAQPFVPTKQMAAHFIGHSLPFLGFSFPG